MLALLSEPAVRDEVDRVAAAVGVGVIHLQPSAAPPRKTWSAAAAVVLDADGAARCRDAALPRRPAVFLLTTLDPDKAAFELAITVGAQQLLTMPEQAGELVRGLATAAEAGPTERGRGEVAAVIAGRGGAGASLFSAALAQAADEALLIDLDPWGGGIDLLLGGEAATGLRWPDLGLQGGRLSWTAIRDALPRIRGVSVLSGTRQEHELAGSAVDAVVEAGRRGGATVVCDLPRRLTAAVETALDAADLVVLVTQCDVRACAATAAMAPAVVSMNPNVGLVVRGPSPGGLSAADVGGIVGLPVLAAMRPEPLLAEKLERGGLHLRARSPLSVAARQVLAVLRQNPQHPAHGQDSAA
ncbi:MAG: septum site-determining protein Ssd [Mycobacterium sp.]